MAWFPHYARHNGSTSQSDGPCWLIGAIAGMLRWAKGFEAHKVSVAVNVQVNGLAPSGVTFS
jgi:hypothetical protein